MAGSNTFGGTIKLQGEKEYRQAITQVNSDLKVLGSELGKVTAEFGRNDKSVDGLNAKNKVLTDQIGKQQKKISTLRGALETSSEKYGENDKKTQNWQISLNKAEAELIKMQKELSSNNQELDKSTNLNERATNSINQLDNELGGLNSQLEKVNEKYKNSGDSVEGFKEKQSVLTEILGKQSDKVDVLKDTLEKSKSAFGENSTETQKWQQALNSAEKNVEETKNEIKNLDSELEKAEKSSSKFGDTFKGVFSAEMTIKAIDGIIEGVKNLASALGEAIISAAKYGDEILEISTKTGVSTKTLQEFSAVSELLDVDLNTFTGSLTKNIKSMNGARDGTGAAAEAYKKLGVAVTDSGGSLREGEVVFWEAIDALSKMSNETERDAISLQLFGKSALELNPLIKTGSEGFKEMSNKAHEMGIVMDNEVLESLGDVDDAMHTWNNTVKGLVNSLSASLAPELSNLINSASGVVSEFSKVIGSIGKDDGSFEKNLGGLKEKLGEFFKVFGESETIQKIIRWGLIVAGAIIAIAPLIVAAVSTVMALVTGAVAAWPIALGAVLIGGLVLFWPQISQFFDDMWNGLTSWLGELWTNITSFLEQHWLDLLLWIFAWPAALIKTLVDFWPQISSWLSGLWSNITAWLSATWNNLTKWFVELKNNMVSKAKDMLSSTVDWFKKLPGDIWNAIVGAVSKVAEWGSSLASKGREAAQNPWNSIVNGIKNLPNEIFNIGKNLVQGLWNGINDMVGWIKSKIQGFGSAVMSAIKGIFGIASPSKLMRDEIGKNLALGIGEGFSAEMKSISTEMQNAIPKEFDTAVNMALNSDLSSYSNSKSNDNFDYMISAFQTALSSMAVTIDGDKMGELVINKVERAVYA